ncbi:MAG: hypothetical protein AAB415_00260 [Patescibacteria group bacterium]
MKSYIIVGVLSVAIFGLNLARAESVLPAMSIIRSAPADGSVYSADLLQPSAGIWSVTLYMTNLFGWRGEASDFLVKTSGGEIWPIERAQGVGLFGANVVVLVFAEPLPIGRTRIIHLPSQSNVCVGVLPGDADGNGRMLSADASKILAVANGFLSDTFDDNLSTDINRDGQTTGADYDKFIDIFSGQNGQRNPPVRVLPACPAI